MTIKELIEMLEPHRDDTRKVVLWISIDCGRISAPITSIDCDLRNKFGVYIQSLASEREVSA